MGDMADFILDTCDYFDDEFLLAGMSPPYDPPWPISYKTCRCCGEKYLH